VLVLIVAFAPHGIVGLLADLRARFARLRGSLLERAHG
jgi:hypothetical protein